MASRIKPRTGQKPVYQDSPFLHLPYDIRLLIYSAALIRPTPIDLWPRTYVSNPEDDPSLAPRVAKARTRSFYHDERDDCPPTFRRQDGLRYVRTEMATGLLGTCKQIHHEAADIFWRGNTFRFSSDIEWYGVRRFLGSIGPRAVSRIRTLEVFAPLVESDCLDTRMLDDMDENRRIAIYANCREAKNVPKMHMVKALKEPWTGKFWYLDGGVNHPRMMMQTGEEITLKRNVDHVCYLLEEASSSLELRLVVPEGFSLVPPTIHRLWVTRASLPPNDKVHLPETLLRIGERFARGMTLVVEAGACLNGVDFPKEFTSQGINVVCEPGSLMRQNANRRPPLSLPMNAVELAAPMSWVDDTAKFDFLVGVPSLLDDTLSDTIALPAGGGKANKRSGHKRTERVLRGFGGCRFVRRQGWDCNQCGKTGVYGMNVVRHIWPRPPCESCGVVTGVRLRDVVEVRKITRAISQGHVDGKMMLMGSRAAENSL